MFLYFLLTKFPGYKADELLAEPAERLERWLILAHAESEVAKLHGR